jgi:site-specific recombinase XerD
MYNHLKQLVTRGAREAGKTPVDVLDEHIADFIHSRRAANRRDSTISSYRTALGEYRRFAGEWPPSADSINAFLVHKRDARCADGTIRTYYQVLCTFCTWLHEHGVLPDNPINLAEEPDEVKYIPRAIKPDALTTLLGFVERQTQAGNWLAIRDHAILRLAYDTGCRSAEVATSLLEDLDLGRRELFVRRARTKSRKGRPVYFGERAGKALEAWLALRPADSGFDEIFLSHYQGKVQPLTRYGLYQSLQKWAEKAGIAAHLKFHALRHSFAIYGLRRGLPINHIQKQLGHANLKTTAIYLEVEDEERRQDCLKFSPGDGLDELAGGH